jgi:hypothetical protein
LDEGKYLIREIVPEGYIVDPGEEQVVAVHAGGESVVEVIFITYVPQGCSPGFWQGGNGSIQWDEDDDPDWTGVGTNPFIHTTLFNDFFNDTGDVNGNGLTDIDTRLDGLNMFQIVSNSGGSANSAEKAARDLVAAYLNETAFPSTYSAESLLQLETDWYDAVAGGDPGLDSFHNIVSPWNAPSDPGFCPLP